MDDPHEDLACLRGTKASQTRDRIRIVVDHRERNSGVPEALDHLQDVELQIEHLPLGDYLIDGTLLFERKCLLDLTLSIKDARLFRQAGRLAADRRHAAFILEGTSNDLKPSRMSREAIQGALIAVTIGYGLPLLRSMNPAETARLMIYTARQAHAWSIGALLRRARRPRTKQRTQLHLLQGLPRIGPERAKRLLATFGSVEAVLRADVDELTMVDGIGATTAEKIRWVVSERAPSYTSN